MSVQLYVPFLDDVGGAGFLLPGVTVQAEARYNGSVASDVVWSSASDAVARVSELGMITTFAAGSFTLSAVVHGTAVSKDVVVADPDAVKVNVSKRTLAKGQTAAATAIAGKAGLQGGRVAANWTSGDASIASLDAAGTISGVASGDAVIGVESRGRFNGRLVSVEAASSEITGIMMTLKTPTLVVGQKTIATAGVTPSDAPNTGVTWASSNTAVAQISSSGAITALAVGTATITAIANANGMRASQTLTVVAAMTDGLTLIPETIDMHLDAWQQVTVLLPNGTTPVNATWTSSDPTVISTKVTEDRYYLTAHKVGTATLTAKSGAYTGSITVAVNNRARSVGSHGVVFDSYYMKPGEKNRAQITGWIGTPDVEWFSYHPEVATVDANGVVTAVSVNGQQYSAPASIQCNVSGCPVGMSTVRVFHDYVRATNVEITNIPDSYMMALGEKLKLSCVVTPANCSDQRFWYMSTDPRVAEISADGEITAKKLGSTYIWVHMNYQCQMFLVEVVEEVPTLEASAIVSVGDTFNPSSLLDSQVASQFPAGATRKYSIPDLTGLTSLGNNLYKATDIGEMKVVISGGGKVAVATITRLSAQNNRLQLTFERTTRKLGEEVIDYVLKDPDGFIIPKNDYRLTVRWPDTVYYETGKPELHCIRLGTTYLYAIYQGRTSNSVTITVEKPVAPTSLTKAYEHMNQYLQGNFIEGYEPAVTFMDSVIDYVKKTGAPTSLPEFDKKSAYAYYNANNTKLDSDTIAWSKYWTQYFRNRDSKYSAFTLRPVLVKTVLALESSFGTKTGENEDGVWVRNKKNVINDIMQTLVSGDPELWLFAKRFPYEENRSHISTESGNRVINVNPNENVYAPPVYINAGMPISTSLSYYNENRLWSNNYISGFLLRYKVLTCTGGTSKKEYVYTYYSVSNRMSIALGTLQLSYKILTSDDKKEWTGVYNYNGGGDPDYMQKAESYLASLGSSFVSTAMATS